MSNRFIIKLLRQEQLRQRKEAEDRIAAQNEFLRTSLRGSNKLQALESTPPNSAAFINDAYEDDVSDDSSSQMYSVIGKFLRSLRVSSKLQALKSTPPNSAAFIIRRSHGKKLYLYKIPETGRLGIHSCIYISECTHSGPKGDL